MRCFECLVVFIFLLEVGFSYLGFFACITSNEKLFFFVVFLIACHAGAVLFLLVFFCFEENVPVHKSIPNCVYPFNTYTAGGGFLTKQISSSHTCFERDVAPW